MKKKFVSVTTIISNIILFGCADFYADSLIAETRVHDYTQTGYVKLLKKSKNLLSGSSGILAGMGYVSDTESLSPAVCFNPLTITRSNQSSKINFDSSESISEIANDFNVSAEVSTEFGLFNSNAMFEYMKQVKEDDYSLSLNYIQKIFDSVNITYSYSPISILNQTGKEIYQDGNNPMFRLFCGDRLVTSYEEGAALIMTMKINFQDRYQKESFKAHMGGSFGSFIKASAQMQSIASQYKLNGNVHVSAFQLGGDPSQLSRILDPSITSCDLNHIESCQQGAAALIRYANDNFPNQFVKEGSIWKSPLVPLGSYTKGYRVTDIGLKLSPSFISPQTIATRKNLATLFTNNKRNFDGFSHIVNNYPVPLGGTFKSKMENNMNNSEANMKLLLNGINGNDAARDCWLFPSDCQRIANKLITNLKPIDKKTLAEGPYHNYPFPFRKDALPYGALGPVIKFTGWGGSEFWPTGESDVAWNMKNGVTGGVTNYMSYGEPSYQEHPPFMYATANGWINWKINQGYGTFHASGAWLIDNTCVGQFKVESKAIPTQLDSATVTTGTQILWNTWHCGWDTKTNELRNISIRPNPYYFEVL